MARLPEYDEMDAIGLAELIKEGAISPHDALAAALERLDAHQPVLNMVVARMEAEALDTIERGLPDGPFAGVPFLLKDLAASYAGVATTFGSRLFEGFVPDHDTTLVARYRAAGLVIFGKTNTPEMGLSATTEPAAFGPTRNPWNPERSAGGSSGGSAAAVAARVVPIAHATDGGGSIRIPAANCGLVGLKPTRGRNPAGPDVGEGWSGMSAGHVVSRSVRDSAAMLDATHGPAPGDPYAAPPPARAFLDEVGADPGRLRIALGTTAASGVPVDPACVAAAESAAKLCEELGHTVETADPPYDFDLALSAMRVIWSANVRVGVDNRCKALEIDIADAPIEATTRAFAEEGRRHDAAAYAHAIMTMHGIGRRFAAFQASYDVILTPTLARPPWLLGAIDMGIDDLDRYLADLFGHMPFTAQFNITGQPAISLPLHWTDDDLPVGVQFAGRFGDEATLIGLASQIEAARPWSNRRPQSAGQTE